MAQHCLWCPGGGNKILEVDYDTYARGEAELGWLNTSISLIVHEETDWNTFALEVTRRIQSELASRSAEVGHLKLLMTNSTGQVISNATSIVETPTAQGSMGSDDGPLTLVLNARAHVEPDHLKSIVECSIAAVAGDAIEVFTLSLRSSSPAYPRPTHRIDTVIQP